MQAKLTHVALLCALAPLTLQAQTTPAEQQLQLGQALLDQHRYPEAMDAFEAVLGIDPASSTAAIGERTAAIQLALQARNSGNGDAALLCLEHAHKAIPHDVPLLVALGIQAESMHRLKEAQEALDDALAREPGNSKALYAMARVETDQGDFTNAERHFQLYLEANPADASAHYGLGHALQLEQKSIEASAEFQRSIALQPVQTESYYQLGQMALDAGKEAEARDNFNKVLSRMPTHGGALTGMGILDYRAKEYAEARDWLQKAVASSPDFQPAHYFLGLTLKRMGDDTAAARELKLATDLAAKQQGRSAPVQQDASLP